jgi:hypothetical protein
MMKKLLIASTALALVAGTVSVPTKADAHVWWLWPAIIAGTAGVAVGASAANAHDVYRGQDIGPRGDIRVRPMRDDCQIVRERAPNGMWHRVEVCD